MWKRKKKREKILPSLLFLNNERRKKKEIKKKNMFPAFFGLHLGKDKEKIKIMRKKNGCT